MNEKKGFCLLLGKFPTYLDHITPLSIELKLPLIITELDVFETAKKYYPKANIIHCEFFHLITHFIVKSDFIISCITPKVLRAAFSPIKKLDYYWIPHGTSDKGTIIKGNFNTLQDEKNLFVYGNNLKKMIKDQLQLNDLHFTITKNFRYYHYLKNKTFYMQKIQNLKLKNNKPILLYAPSWNGVDECSSFNSCLNFFEKLKQNFTVICKWHPHLLWQEPEQIAKIELLHPDICFLKEFPLIYPLLSITEFYIGDVSSVGYDFLAFEKPMIFLNEKNLSPALFSCGTVLTKDRYACIEDAIKKTYSIHKEKHLPLQKKLYEYSYGKKESVKEFDQHFKKLREKIFQEDSLFIS